MVVTLAMCCGVRADNLGTPELGVPELGAPVWAAHQKRVVSEVFKYEAEQFRQRANFLSAQNKQDSIAKRRDLQLKAFERAQNLVARGQMTEEQLHKAQQNYQDAEDAVSKNIADTAKAKGAALVAKYRLLEIGNPGSNYRVEIAKAMLEAATGERMGFEKSLGSYQTTRGYFQKRFESGKYLFERNAISLQDLECRELEFNLSEDNVRTIEFQIAGLNDVAQGLQLSLKKLGR